MLNVNYKHHQETVRMSRRQSELTYANVGFIGDLRIYDIPGMKVVHKFSRLAKSVSFFDIKIFSEMVFRYVSTEFPNISNMRGDEDKTSESLDKSSLYAIFGRQNVGNYSGD